MDYKSTRWKEKRKRILSRDKYLCRNCVRYGKYKTADTVHHMKPAEFYPQYIYCNWNLISLCNKCHNAMHDRDTHELTELGRKLAEKAIPPSV